MFSTNNPTFVYFYHYQDIAGRRSCFFFKYAAFTHERPTPAGKEAVNLHP